MIDGMVTVKEYAEMRGKSVQSVYKQMKSRENAASLEGHIHVRKVNNKDVKLLDEEAVKVLDDASQKSVQVIMQTDDKERIEQLENENKQLLLELASVNKKLNDVRDRLDDTRELVHKLEMENTRLIESIGQNDEIAAASDIPDEKPWWMFWKK